MDHGFCQTQVHAELVINKSTSVFLDTTVCGSFLLPSKTRYVHLVGMYFDTIQNAKGCDSVLLIRLKNISVDASYRIDSGVLLAENTSFQSYQWYDCTTESPIPGATDTIFTPTETGFYALEVSDGTCPNRSGCVEVIVDEPQKAGLTFEVSPNPTHDKVKVRFNHVQTNIEIELYNVQGQLIEHSTYLNLAILEVALPNPGLYFLRLRSSELDEEVVKVQRI
jgi:hypothetical protein